MNKFLINTVGKKKGLHIEMRGHYCEINLEGKVRFFEIYTYEYDKTLLERLIKTGCLDNSSLGDYIKLIGKPIPDSTLFLYELQTYIGLVGIDDLWEFNEKISDYEKFGFYDIEDLLEFCSQTWNVKKEDFKPIEKTNIPN